MSALPDYRLEPDDDPLTEEEEAELEDAYWEAVDRELDKRMEERR